MTESLEIACFSSTAPPPVQLPAGWSALTQCSPLAAVGGKGGGDAINWQVLPNIQHCNLGEPVSVGEPLRALQVEERPGRLGRGQPAFFQPVRPFNEAFI